MKAQQNITSMNVQGLEILKYQARTDSKKALPEVAKQFEALFLQSMLKSMRMGQMFLDENSPFKGKNEATFQEMLDSQYSTNISGGQGIGFATMLAKQLENSVQDVSPIGPIQPVPIPKPVKTETLEEFKMSEIAEADDSPMDNFIKSAWPYARKAASVLGLDPKILMAQAALETGWGKFVAKDVDGSSSNNLFNIKSSKNTVDSVSVKTKEYIANTPITTQANFRKYSSVEESFNDYVSFIQGNERYQDALQQVADPERFMQALHKAGYATDPNYSNKILSIYHGNELQNAMQRCGLGE